MNTEWDVVRDYLDSLVERAPPRLRPQALALRSRYAVMEAERQGAFTLIERIELHDPTTTLPSEPVDELEASFQRRWQPFFSAAADLGAWVSRATHRSKSAHLDHAADRAIAKAAYLRHLASDRHVTLRSAILHEAEKRGAIKEGQDDTLYRRVKRLIEARDEGVQHEVAFALHLALRDK